MYYEVYRLLTVNFIVQIAQIIFHQVYLRATNRSEHYLQNIKLQKKCIYCGIKNESLETIHFNFTL